MALIPVSVHCGVFKGFDNAIAAAGEITFTPLGGWMRSPIVPAEYVPEPFSVAISAGQATVTLLAPTQTDDPSVVYRVKVAVPGLPADVFVIRMPVNPTTSVPLELSSRDDNQGVLDPLGVGSSSDGGFGNEFGGFGGGGGIATIDASAAEINALYGLMLVLDG